MCSQSRYFKLYLTYQKFEHPPFCFSIAENKYYRVVGTNDILFVPNRVKICLMIEMLKGGIHRHTDTYTHTHTYFKRTVVFVLVSEERQARVLPKFYRELYGM